MVLEALNALVFVNAWGLVAWSMIIEIKAYIALGPNLFRYWGGFVCCHRGPLGFLGHDMVSCLIELKYVQLRAFLARPVKHWLNVAVSITDQSVF